MSWIHTHQMVTLDGQSLMVLSQGYQSITWQRLRLKCCRSIRRSASKNIPIVVNLLCIYRYALIFVICTYTAYTHNMHVCIVRWCLKIMKFIIEASQILNWNTFEADISDSFTRSAEASAWALELNDRLPGALHLVLCLGLDSWVGWAGGLYHMDNIVLMDTILHLLG